ncbi:hypothetical protein [Hydrogenophaga sp.]|uniref:hypothetical protein n=1 Tax=Hydrogenophaga sp. TaxID=1904254 RepID=UPI0019CA8E3F|nr:hypothetical protein [Hydrogenophaga sp.]MBD3894192.1 hypothetical protein [Hydrogenophaga sp.]
MLNISTHHVVAWPQPQPAIPGVAPVAAVGAARPTQDGRRETQAGLGGERGAQSAARNALSPFDPAEPGLEPAAVLPRGSSGGKDALPDRSASELARPGKAEQIEQAREQAEQAREQSPASEQLQEVLTSVWQASAAVVDRMLGRQSAAQPGAALASVQGGAGPSSPIAAPTSAAVAMPLAPAAVDETGLLEPLVSAPQAQAQSLVVYDENGNGSRSAPQAGSLVSERV